MSYYSTGGGQPTDHGTVVPLSGSQSESISITNVQRQGLRCVYHLPKPLSPGTTVRQEVDFDRRWDHMQQHTGQHLLSAVMNKYDNLNTLGWGMGSADKPNYVELPRKPSENEIQKIQDECNRLIRENLTITTEYSDNAQITKLPGDYDADKGAIRVVKIGDLDNNTCCGTHLRQTSHIGLILLHSTQPVHSKNVRLFFTAGDRAIKLSTASIASLRSIAKVISSGPTPSETQTSIATLKDNVADLKKKEAKLLQEIAKFEADQARTTLQNGKNAWIHRADQGLDFINVIIAMVKNNVEGAKGTVLVAATGEEKAAGSIVIVGDNDAVDSFAAKIKETGIQVKGGGRGGRWQGKVVKWGKGELGVLERLVSA